MDRLSNTVRPYAWGSTTAIPALLGIAPTGEPQAEMWMGAHPGAPSRLTRTTATTGETEIPLTEAIETDPEGELGADTVARFGPRLPFLLKLLAAGAPLSVQVHPNLEQAREGYADEEARGVPIDAPHRTYKDANHKPELICALTPAGVRLPAARRGRREHRQGDRRGRRPEHEGFRPLTLPGSAPIGPVTPHTRPSPRTGWGSLGRSV
ncbi:hypothetical protein SCALM49S_08564 [Streptomyces californicus]